MPLDENELKFLTVAGPEQLNDLVAAIKKSYRHKPMSVSNTRTVLKRLMETGMEGLDEAVSNVKHPWPELITEALNYNDALFRFIDLDEHHQVTIEGLIRFLATEAADSCSASVATELAELAEKKPHLIKKFVLPVILAAAERVPHDIFNVLVQEIITRTTNPDVLKTLFSSLMIRERREEE